jgi:hypothetical protein
MMSKSRSLTRQESFKAPAKPFGKCRTKIRERSGKISKVTVGSSSECRPDQPYMGSLRVTGSGHDPIL